MQRRTLAVLLLLVVVVSCGPQPAATATMIFVPPTNPPPPTERPTIIPTTAPVPTATAIVVATAARVSTPTRTTVPSRLPSATPLLPNTPIPAARLQAPGVPVAARQPGPRMSDQVNKANAHIYQYRAHGRDIQVYVEQEGVLTEAQERERADYCFEMWTRDWEIFGGYAFSTYECVISNRLGDPARGSSGITYWSRYGASFVVKSGWHELMAHEIFHAWNFGHLPYEELWFAEGMAQYYNYRLTDPNRALQMMKDMGARSVPEWIQKGIDAPLVNIQRGSSNENLAYYKGALVWYMLDVEISERTGRTKSLDNVLRRLYLQYGTQGIMPGPRPPAPPRQTVYDAIIAEGGAPEFFKAFFKDYIEGARDLREWHNGLFKNSALVYLPPHPAVP